MCIICEWTGSSSSSVQTEKMHIIYYTLYIGGVKTTDTEKESERETENETHKIIDINIWGVRVRERGTERDSHADADRGHGNNY